jgi:transcriptional regulator with XRE-family HTH domain
MVSGEKDLRPESQEMQLAVVALLSTRLRRWRKSRRLPLKQMASDLGVSISLVSAWETGARFPSATHLEQISAYTGVPICQFFYPQPWGCPNRKPGCGLDL